MTTLICKIPKCGTTFSTDAPLSPRANFVCKNHYFKKKPASYFQAKQFDKELDGKLTERETEDENWGLHGSPISPSQKCDHGVYDPTEDQRYCTVCHPTSVVAVSRLKKTKIGSVGIFKNETEQQDQAFGLLVFLTNLPQTSRPDFVNPEHGAVSAKFAEDGRKLTISGKANAQWRNKKAPRE